MGNAATIHASCVVIGEAGILIRGGSGSGKSTLARELVHAAAASGRFARLVSDDRTHVAARNGRLVARVVEAIAGRLEARGAGIFAVAHEPSRSCGWCSICPTSRRTAFRSLQIRPSTYAASWCLAFANRVGHLH
jgi:serine kinase of HPr protein (carbohydrate metabolism regulator)